MLHDIGFEVNRGDAIGIVGPSGAGESTLIQLLLNLRTPKQGVYHLINGAPAADFLSADWHARVAYVPQEPRLLHATVRNNICYFREATDAVVEPAAKLARIHDDILAWPNGYDTLIGPRADAISGGQQQRICIARALAAQPEILSSMNPQARSIPSPKACFRSRCASFQGPSRCS